MFSSRVVRPSSSAYCRPSTAAGATAGSAAPAATSSAAMSASAAAPVASSSISRQNTDSPLSDLSSNPSHSTVTSSKANNDQHHHPHPYQKGNRPGYSSNEHHLRVDTRPTYIVCSTCRPTSSATSLFFSSLSPSSTANSSPTVRARHERDCCHSYS